MNNIERVKMELIDKGFTQKMADKYTNLQLFTTNFTPILSTKRISPHRGWLELVYALPHIVLRREIFNSFKKTKNVFASVKRIWNIFMYLDFPLSRNEYITTRLHRFSREIMKIQDSRSRIQVKPASSPSVNLVKSRNFYFAYPYGLLERETLLNRQEIFSQLKQSPMGLTQPVSPETLGLETEKGYASVNYQLPVVMRQLLTVSHKLPAVRHEDQMTYILTNTNDFITHLFSYYSLKPSFFLRQKTVPVKQQGVFLNLQKSDAAYSHYAHLERETLLNGQRMISNFKSSSTELAQPVSHGTSTSRIETEKESASANYQLPVVTHLLPTLSHKPAVVNNESMERTTILPSAKDFNFMHNQQMHLNTLEVKETQIYHHTYPEIEHVTSTQTEILKERVLEKEEESKPPHATPQLPSVDVNRLADQVYSFIERKIRIEKERRGLYG